MPISPLPEDSVRRLGSSLVITSPVLLLKELIENAIDSGATCIEILVSQNTVDKLEVRDNGRGIHPDDLDFLGRPGHTSKLRSLDELNDLGGNTLGFRGVALASANRLGDVSVISRVSSEPVAAVVSLAKGGGIGTQRHAAAPVGTIVCVTGLFKGLPVRLRVAVKEAARNLAKMQELLQSYALTRPWLRLRFTVLKSPNLSWSYAPVPGGSVTEAAMQLFGTALASQCTFRTFPGVESQSDADPTNTLVCEALLPRPGADPDKINKGAFLSVDSRPVSAKRGTAKKLVSIFKKRMGVSLNPSRSDDVPREPFIRLNIRCPPGTYDVNVEPSKDDVLFKDEQRILDQFESFLSLVYPVPEPCDSPRPSVPAVVAGCERSPCETPSAVSANPPSRPLAPLNTVSSWKVDMYSSLEDMDGGDNSGDLDAEQSPQRGADEVPASGPEDDMSEAIKGQSSKEGLNPWSIARLTSSNRRGDPLANERKQEVRQQAPLQLPVHGSAIDTDGTSALATRASGAGDRLEFQPSHQVLDHPASEGKSLRDVLGHVQHRASASSAWSSNRRTRSRRNHVLQSPPTSSPREYDYDAVSSGERRAQRPARRSDGLVQAQISFDRNNRRQGHHDRVRLDGNQLLSEPVSRNPRIRTSASAAAHRLWSEEGNFMFGGPAGINAGRERDTRPDEETQWPGSAIDDARAQLIKQQRLGTQNPQRKSRRTKTEQLPLETIPHELQTCTLLITVRANVDRVAQLLTKVSRFDTWFVDGKLRGAFEDLTSPEEKAKLVEPLLAHISHGRAVAT
ncbi:uncharacterized protein B0T15DRAFT_425660 [Chaetomium strumarium]|uniref:DNA mismatch repair protein S5 domain-containing protein n=1 Tax=Chaetomium strumarium TaxID=1170767 RepID=A0AAJ0M657_9PEZI|nr:hypothetical protein B0T15DRAFT_425660 [Chaetomium strumarium]